MKQKLKFTKRSYRLGRTKRRFCVDIRLVLMFLLMFHYAEPLSRRGCYIHMEKIKVNGEDPRINILKSAGGTIPVGPNVKNEGTLFLDQCQTRCNNTKETCYLLVLDNTKSRDQTCYLGNKEATFYLDPEESSTVLSESYIHLCGHPVKEGEDCYHTATTMLKGGDARGTTYIDNINTPSACGEECNKKPLCYGYYHRNPDCSLYENAKGYTINLEHVRSSGHAYGYKKCFACADEPCMNGGTCAHVSGTCCDYDCTCQGGTTGKHCENCNPGYGLEGQLCKPCGIGLFNPAVGLECKECTGAGVTTNSTGSKSCDACEVSFGKNGTNNGHVTCKKCDGNMYSDTRDDSECKDCGSLMIPTNNHTGCVCKPGYEQGNLDCEPCANGWFNPSKDSTCDKCPGEGVTTKSTGSKSCDACDVSFGKNGTNNGHITCKKCDGNTYSATKDNSECKDCGSLMIPTNDHTKCVCKPGYEQGNPNCETCAKGWFNPSKGSTCKKCSLKGAGVTTTSTGSKICDACKAGYGKKSAKNGHITCEKCTGNTYSDKTDGSKCDDCGDGMRPTDDHKGCESVPTSSTVTSVTPSTGKTLSSSTQTPPTGKTLRSSTQTQPTGETFKSSTQTQPTGETFESSTTTLPNAKTFESSTTTLPAGETLNNSTPSPPTGKTLNSSLPTLSTGKTLNSSLPTLRTGNSFNSSTTQTLPTTKNLIMPAANPSKIPRGKTSKIMPKMIQWVLCLQLTLFQLQKLLQH